MVLRERTFTRRPSRGEKAALRSSITLFFLSCGNEEKLQSRLSVTSRAMFEVLSDFCLQAAEEQEMEEQAESGLNFILLHCSV